jgi:hypothetical protein
MGGWGEGVPDFELWECDPDTYKTKQMVNGGPGVKKRQMIPSLLRKYGSWKCKISRRAGSNETVYEFSKTE